MATVVLLKQSAKAKTPVRKKATPCLKIIKEIQDVQRLPQSFFELLSLQGADSYFLCESCQFGCRQHLYYCRLCFCIRLCCFDDDSYDDDADEYC